MKNNRLSFHNLLRLLLAVVFVSMTNAMVYASVTTKATSNRIQGIADFLLERANDNYLFILATQIQENKIFQCYFPNTYNYAINGRESFKLLLMSTDLWKRSVEKDLEALATREIYTVLSSGKAGDIDALLRDSYIELLQKTSISYEGQLYPLTSIPINAPQQLRDTINQFYTQANQAITTLTELKNDLRLDSSGCVTANDSFGKFKEDLAKVTQALQLTRNQLKVFDDNKTKLVLADDYQRYYKTPESIIKSLTHIEALGRNIEQAQIFDSVPTVVNAVGAQVDRPQSERVSYLSRVIEIESIISEAIQSGINPLNLDVSSKDYARFRRYIISFAALADAESPESVKIVMQELTLPPVSFGLKREPGENNVFISAYVGLATGAESSESDGDKSYGGLFAPVGIEYSYGIPGYGSVSVMLAPLDFAHPMNLKLENKEEDIQVEDIIRPGLYLSYGLKKYPISFGLGASRGQALRTETNDSEMQYSAFVVLDMPLFQLF